MCVCVSFGYEKNETRERERESKYKRKGKEVEGKVRREKLRREERGSQGPISHLAELIMTMSPFFPISSDPWLSDRPREAAALMVAAARASGIVRWRFTHARCITSGFAERERECVWAWKNHYQSSR